MSDINMQIIDGYDHIISEKGNVFIALRKIKWSEDSDTKLDLRKYITTTDGGERCQKGVCFDDEAADELTKVLCETGYGDTREIIDSIKDRDNFMPSLCRSLSGDNKEMLQKAFPDMEFPEVSDDELEDFIDIRNELM